MTGKDLQSFTLRYKLHFQRPQLTNTEITTVLWVTATTKIPVSQIVDFEEDRAEPTAYEWILQRNPPGLQFPTLGMPEYWSWANGYSPKARESFVNQLVEHTLALFSLRFSGIGTLGGYGRNGKGACTVGMLVDETHIRARQFHEDVVARPYLSDREWLTARIEFVRRDCDRTLHNLDRIMTSNNI